MRTRMLADDVRRRRPTMIARPVPRSRIRLWLTGHPGAGGRILEAAFRIHNGPAQFLATALGQLRLLQEQIPSDLARAHASLEHSIASTEAALASTRRAIAALRPFQRAVETSPLLSRLRRAIEELRSITASEFTINAGALGRLPSAVVAGLAALGEEALTNAARHARADHIVLDVRRRGDLVTLQVGDDGGKAEPDGAGHAKARSPGLGRRLMRDQIRLLGGRLTIRALPSGGTIVRAAVPVPRKDNRRRRHTP